MPTCLCDSLWKCAIAAKSTYCLERTKIIRTQFYNHKILAIVGTTRIKTSRMKGSNLLVIQTGQMTNRKRNVLVKPSSIWFQNRFTSINLYLRGFSCNLTNHAIPMSLAKKQMTSWTSLSKTGNFKFSCTIIWIYIRIMDWIFYEWFLNTPTVILTFSR